MIKKGFTYIYLLYSLAISGILAGMAMPSLTLYDDYLTKKSMKEDMSGFRDLLELKYLETENYSALITSEEESFTDNTENGVAENTFTDNSKVYVSKDNTINFKPVVCSTLEQGFEIVIKNKKYVRTYLEFNSCTFSKPILVSKEWDNFRYQVLEQTGQSYYSVDYHTISQISRKRLDNLTNKFKEELEFAGIDTDSVEIFITQADIGAHSSYERSIKFAINDYANNGGDFIRNYEVSETIDLTD